VDINDLIGEAIAAIESFYRGSFKLPPQRCLPFIAVLVDRLEQIKIFLTEKQTKKLNRFLAATLQAMQAGDYVLVNDYLVYEMKPFLASLAVKKLH
jgi:hypothetical protein